MPVKPLKGRCRLEPFPALAVDADRWNQHEPFGIAVRRRGEEDALDEAEDSGGRADTERQRQRGDRREARLLAQHPHRETEILQHVALPKL